MVQRLHGLRHDAVVRGHHQHGQVGDLGTTGTHGGERLVARGVDEGHRTFAALVLVHDLVRTDVLGDAAVLALDHVGLADGIEQTGLTVVDVAHDGHHRGTLFEHVLGFGFQLGIQVQPEAFEQFAVLVLRGDHQHLVAQLLAEHLEGGLIQRLGRGGHFAQVEQHGDQGCRVRADLVGEIGDGRTAAQPDLGRTQGRSTTRPMPRIAASG